MEKLPSHVIRAILVKSMAANQPNMDRSNFFDHFEFEIKKIKVNFLQKVALDQIWHS